MTRAAAVAVRKARTAARQRPAVIALVPVAWMLIGLSSALIAVWPFRKLAPLLGRSLGAVSLAPLVTPRAMRRGRTIGRAVTIAAKYAPFRSNCLPQALAAVLLCRCGRVPYAAHLGATPSDPERDGAMAAHAWVQCGPLTITGGKADLQLYGVVACFVPHRIAVAQ